MCSLSALFDEHFEVVTAETPDLITQVFRLRYLVYCIEHPWLDPAGYPEGLERDQYDDRSLYAVLIHRRSGEALGSVRLVLPEPRLGVDSLPIAGLSDPRARPLLRRLLPEHTAEISRYVVSKTFRRRLGEECYADVGFNQAAVVEAERRLMPSITLGLLRGVYRLSLRHGMTHLCAVMEPALMRLVSRLGLEFNPIGTAVAFHGVRQPCYLQIDRQHDAVLRTNANFYDVITAGAQHGTWSRRRNEATCLMDA